MFTAFAFFKCAFDEKEKSDDDDDESKFRPHPDDGVEDVDGVALSLEVEDGWAAFALVHQARFD